MTAIACREVGKTYPGGIEALQKLDLQVEEGKIFGFLGPNGAGKTTTVRILNGTLKPTRGEYRLFGRESGGARVRRESATLSESARLYEAMSARENLLFFGKLYGMSPEEIRERGDFLMDRLGLSGREDDRIGTFSTGMKKRIQLARTLLHRPRILFLDEPTSGLDPEASREVTTLIRNLAASEGTTVFLCTHNLALAEGVCDRIAFLSRGRLIAAGSREELTQGISWEMKLEMTLMDPVTRREQQVQRAIGDWNEVNGILRELMEEGWIIRESRIPVPSLEDLYFRYIGSEKEEG